MKKMISRRYFLKVAGISAAALGLAACGGSGTSTAASTASTAASTGSSAAASGSAVTLKLGFSTNEEDPRAKGAKQFAEEVAEKTGGAVEVQLYPSGQLGGDADLINSIALDSGTVDIIITDASNFATYDAKMGISALPFQFETFDDAWAFMDSDIEAGPLLQRLPLRDQLQGPHQQPCRHERSADPHPREPRHHGYHDRSGCQPPAAELL